MLASRIHTGIIMHYGCSDSFGLGQPMPLLLLYLSLPHLTRSPSLPLLLALSLPLSLSLPLCLSLPLPK